jgi:hypothetical protein
MAHLGQVVVTLKWCLSLDFVFALCCLASSSRRSGTRLASFLRFLAFHPRFVFYDDVYTRNVGKLIRCELEEGTKERPCYGALEVSSKTLEQPSRKHALAALETRCRLRSAIHRLRPQHPVLPTSELGSATTRPWPTMLRRPRWCRLWPSQSQLKLKLREERSGLRKSTSLR